MLSHYNIPTHGHRILCNVESTLKLVSPRNRPRSVRFRLRFFFVLKKKTKNARNRLTFSVNRPSHFHFRFTTLPTCGRVKKRTWCGRTKMSTVAPSTAAARSPSAVTFEGSLTPGRYLTFSCSWLMTSVRHASWPLWQTCSGNTHCRTSRSKPSCMCAKYYSRRACVSCVAPVKSYAALLGTKTVNVQLRLYILCQNSTMPQETKRTSQTPNQSFQGLHINILLRTKKKNISSAHTAPAANCVPQLLSPKERHDIESRFGV